MNNAAMPPAKAAAPIIPTLTVSLLAAPVPPLEEEVETGEPSAACRAGPLDVPEVAVAAVSAEVELGASVEVVVSTVEVMGMEEREVWGVKGRTLVAVRLYALRSLAKAALLKEVL